MVLETELELLAFHRRPAVTLVAAEATAEAVEAGNVALGRIFILILGQPFTVAHEAHVGAQHEPRPADRLVAVIAPGPASSVGTKEAPPNTPREVPMPTAECALPEQRQARAHDVGRQQEKEDLEVQRVRRAV